MVEHALTMYKDVLMVENYLNNRLWLQCFKGFLWRKMPFQILVTTF